MSEGEPGGYPDDLIEAIDQAGNLGPAYEADQEGTGKPIDTVPVEEPGVEAQIRLGEEHEAPDSELKGAVAARDQKVEDPYLSSSQAAAMLGVVSKTLNRWADQESVPHMTTLGGHRRYKASVISEIFEKMKEAGRKYNPTQ
jgi:hypothetical protein